eukprot:9503632-Pyramimonas_sp.AAC.1
MWLVLASVRKLVHLAGGFEHAIAAGLGYALDDEPAGPALYRVHRQVELRAIRCVRALRGWVLS